MNNWYVYYMNNDGGRTVLADNLSYNAAVKLWQQKNTTGRLFGCNYDFNHFA